MITFPEKIRIGGIRGTTLNDFPNHPAITLFVVGCNFNCPYCHNAILKDSKVTLIPHEEVITELLHRKRLVDGVVISGGEPTIYQELPQLFEYLKSIGYQTCLHTNGSNPDTIQEMITKNIIDYVAVDLKSPSNKHKNVTRSNIPYENVIKTIKILTQSEIEYEVRTTFHPALLDYDDLIEIISQLQALNVSTYYIQKFQSNGVTDEELKKVGDEITIPDFVQEVGMKSFKLFGIR